MFYALLTDVGHVALLLRRHRNALCAALLIVRLAHGLDGFQQLTNAPNWSMAFLFPLIAVPNVELFDTPDLLLGNPTHVVLLALTLKRMLDATHRTHAAL